MIKLMDGGLMDYSPPPRRKTGDAHQVFHNVQKGWRKLLSDGWNSPLHGFTYGFSTPVVFCTFLIRLQSSVKIKECFRFELPRTIILKKHCMGSIFADSFL